MRHRFSSSRQNGLKMAICILAHSDRVAAAMGSTSTRQTDIWCIQYENRSYDPLMPSCAACGRRNNLISGRQRPLKLTPHPARQGPSCRFTVGVDIYSSLDEPQVASARPRWAALLAFPSPTPFATLAIWGSALSGVTNHICGTNYGIGRCIYAMVGHGQCHWSQRRLRSVSGRHGGD